ncbi:hypothetical protein BDZ97DRAFT_1367799 [Flammula alnicola]|nr:hypothetical protein BDZ97DRAFT_1367799 [Flammula alnicola]
MSNVNDFHYYSQGQGGCKLMGRRSCALCTELEEIESLRAELAQKSSQLCVKINRSHSAIFRLPPEIIATIFEAYLYGSSYAEFLYQPQDPMKFPPPDCTPFLLGAVCKVWRDVAWSTPSLWASITIHVDFRHVEQPVQTLLTKEWLSRSGKLPLSIRLLDDLPSRNNDIFQIRPLIAVINQYSPRWRHLHLDLPICLFPFFRPLGDQAPILEYMRIEGQDHFLNDHPANERNANTLRLGAAPRLKCVSIHRITLRLVDIPWENITRFLGEQSSVSECLQILRRAPLLEHCVFQRSSGLTHGYPIFAHQFLLDTFRPYIFCSQFKTPI